MFSYSAIKWLAAGDQKKQAQAPVMHGPKENIMRSGKLDPESKLYAKEENRLELRSPVKSKFYFKYFINLRVYVVHSMHCDSI